MSETILSRGDVIRLRALGSQDEWCICEIAVISTNGRSVGALITDGALRLRGGLIVGAVLIGIDDEAGAAYEVATQTELEIELWRAHCG